MTKITEYILIVSIIFLGTFAVMYVADRSIYHQDTICQEGC